MMSLSEDKQAEVIETKLTNQNLSKIKPKHPISKSISRFTLFYLYSGDFDFVNCPPLDGNKPLATSCVVYILIASSFC